MYDAEKINKIIENTNDSGEFSLSFGKNGKPALKAFKDGCSFFINSKYNPEKEGETFAKEYYTPDKDIFVYGIGMGFHIKAVADMLSDNQKMYILEFNGELLKFALQNTDINEVLSRDNVIFDIPRNFNAAVSAVKEFIYGNTAFVCHEPSVRVIPNEFEEIKEIFETFIIKARSASIAGSLLSDNEKVNMEKGYENGGKVFFNYFKGRRAVIVSAGPSLELNGPKLKQLKNAVIISVGRALKYLKEVGVVPDFAIITDPKESVIGQLDLDETEIPLFFLSTVHPSVENYKSKKYIIFEKYSDMVKEEDRRFCTETGGSVATTALGLCLIMGFSEIILIGQDLCYHSDKMHSGESQGFRVLKGSKPVLGTDGETYFSPPNLYEYLKWFKKFAKRHGGEVRLINCTAKGAFIDGFEHRSIEDFL